MPPVKKPKPQIIKKASPSKVKAPQQKEAVVSGQLKKKLQKGKPKAPQSPQTPERGIVFVKHLPHGFFEVQLRKYFQQFGRVLRLRLGRSKRTGGSKGFAFVEFEYPEVAKVAAETMDNYLMFQKVVKASYIPPAEQKFNYFKTSVKKVTNKAGKDIYVSSQTKSTQRKVKHHNDWNEGACEKRTEAAIKKLQKLQKKYKDLGIDFATLMVEPVKKTKATGDTEPSTSGKSSSKATKSKKEVNLEDLLGNTLNEDSEDEDYEAEEQSEESEEDLGEEEESDSEESEDSNAVKLEDLLGNTINEESADEDYQMDSDEESDVELEEEEESEEDSEGSEEELPSPAPTKKSTKKAAGIEALIKRKPGTGGIQKKKKNAPATTVQVNKKAAAKALQLAEAKKIAQPLQKVKTKKAKK